MPIIGRAIGGFFNIMIEGWGAFLLEKNMATAIAL